MSVDILDGYCNESRIILPPHSGRNGADFRTARSSNNTLASTPNEVLFMPSVHSLCLEAIGPLSRISVRLFSPPGELAFDGPSQLCSMLQGFFGTCAHNMRTAADISSRGHDPCAVQSLAVPESMLRHRDSTGYWNAKTASPPGTSTDDSTVDIGPRGAELS